MYTNIPVDITISYLCDILKDANVYHDTINDFRKLITACLNTNICSFRNVIYRFTDGLPMGNPLSSLVADVYLDRFERDLFSNSMYNSSILHWFRYVDDILCIWTGSTDALNDFFFDLNFRNSNLEFTLEVGLNSINFLDLTISFVECNDEFHTALSSPNWRKTE